LNYAQFQQKVREILATELPSTSEITGQGRSLAGHIRIGRTAFMDRMGVDSEAAYKRQCIRDKTITYHAHIGMGSWQATAEALVFLHNTSVDAGFRVDRAGICLDRRMGLPKDHRFRVPAETGPMLETDSDWLQVGQIVPIQPHMGDFMIGFPASTENTVNALKAGVTTIGNLSQFFAHEVPTWRDHVTTTAETVRALSLMGALRERGALVHSYLEDGFGALFHDCATIAGWALLERYLVEELLDGKIAHCIGGLTTDPVKRAGWIFALNEIHEGDCLGSMFYGDTISFTEDLITNRAIVAEYLIWDIMAQLECPTGHAVLPLPVTEFLRTPSAEEIVDAQNFGKKIEAAARKLLPHMDFSACHDFSSRVVAGGRSVYRNALDGLGQAGVDVRDPIEMLYVLKKVGPGIFEEMFGAGTPDEDYPRGRKPLLPTDVFEMSRACIEANRATFGKPENRKALSGKRMLIASTDVHEHAILVISRLLGEAGVEMINLGAEKDPDEVAEAARAHRVDTILLSTHNGMALEYAHRLREELEKRGIAIPVVMGGVLNQKFESQALPMDVTPNLRKLGYHVCPRLEGDFCRLIALPDAEKGPLCGLDHKHG
jgi:methylmalonyl-CoA mutase cobalamin-binding domain/chain